MHSVRVLIRRFAWQMLGAAIGLAVVLVAVSFIGSIAGAPTSLVVLVTVVAGAALSLVPGVRELEMTAARTMLGTDAELVSPREVGLQHRAQTAGWVLVHLTFGLVVAASLFALIPAAVLVIVEVFAGPTVGSTGIVPIPTTTGGQIAQVTAAALVALAALVLTWPVGVAAARLAGWFLGPTDHDRLDVAVERANREAEHTRLARELHDGIGHALTIVSVQAAAGRRIHDTDPEGAVQAFATIEDTARTALTELDELLGVLRSDRPIPAEPAGRGLDDIVAAQRRAGMNLTANIDAPDDLPALLQRNLHRIVAEGLTNAERHGAPGEVRLSVTHTDDVLVVDVRNPLGTFTMQAGGGRGLAGVRERAALFGGSVDAGPVDDQWTLRATLPRPHGDRP